MHCQSNPITAYATPPALKKYWGDLHAQSGATIGTGTEEEYFTFARDVAFLDFCSHQGNDFQMDDAHWQRLNSVIRRFHADHHFVAFPGWEWSGNTSVGGDRNVWYLDEGLPMFRSSHWQIPHVPETDQTPADTAADLFARLRQLPREKVLLGSHVGGRYADIRAFFDQDLGPLIELVSCWGVFEWMLWDAFDKGYIVGIVCNSDGHKGRPGAEGPGAGQFGIANGLTCVLAEEQTRAGIFHALQNRRCYGTTGARIDLDFRVDAHPMGSILPAAPIPPIALERRRHRPPGNPWKFSPAKKSSTPGGPRPSPPPKIPRSSASPGAARASAAAAAASIGTAAFSSMEPKSSPPPPISIPPSITSPPKVPAKSPSFPKPPATPIGST